MKNSKHLSNGLLYLIFGTSLLGSLILSKKVEKPTLFITKQQSSFNLDNKFWNNFHLGQKRLISSLYWVATILESDHDHYKGKDLNSWMFLRFNTISVLEPNFYENYAFGGPYLSIVKDDVSGGSIIYDKGLHVFPDDYKLLRDAGFHYYFEVENYNKARIIYERLSKHSKLNPLIISSFARLESANGNQEMAYKILLSKYQEMMVKPNFLTDALARNLYALKAEIDLDCLNENKTGCEREDFKGKEYIKVGGKYRAQNEWKPFRNVSKAKVNQ